MENYSLLKPEAAKAAVELMAGHFEKTATMQNYVFETILDSDEKSARNYTRLSPEAAKAVFTMVGKHFEKSLVLKKEEFVGYVQKFQLKGKVKLK
jgi:hypothetical protein